eukprot:gnl/MRDRNA2_/MRDRNA2_34402_c0_seq1.p1 gnl/MRDRNA2_/MRDRNA2_34402_c0~~gnl/MRDRNA2_/MRDRNA2_34402_c0_seq1.p1  ORF type:complete len:283 (+),score=50.94 gnl/MRDRNA2_/MRDRNA2_34402_c0_seq1:105-953(+)
MSDVVQISVSNLNGFLCTIAASSGWSIRELKAAIESSKEVPILEQRLLAGLTELCNTELVGKVATDDNACLTLIRRSANQVALLRMLGIDDEVHKELEDLGVWEGPCTDEKLLKGSLEVGSVIASTAAWFGGRGHLEGYPELYWEWQNMSKVCEIVPKAFRAQGRQGKRNCLIVKPESMVVPPGTYNVVVRLSREMQALLEACGSPAVEELCENKPEGWKVQDIVRLRGCFPPQEACDVLAQAVLEQDPRCDITHTMMRLISYSVGEVLYEVTLVAGNDDDY